MLIGNGVRLSASNPMRQMGAANHGSANRFAFGGPGALLNLYAGEATVVSGTSIANLSGYPSGMRHPGSWSMPIKAGGLSSRYEGEFAFSASGSGALGRNLEGTTTVTLSVPDAALQLIVSGSGAATITFSQTGALAGALAASGSATVTVTAGTPTLGAIIDAVASASLSLSGSATATAIGHLEGSILPYTELSPEGLANAVANISIDGAYTLQEVLRILVAVAAGKTTVTDLGGGSAEVTFRNLSDSLDRVFAEMTGSDRTTVTLDVSE